jgi:hypothetical protein
MNHLSDETGYVRDTLEKAYRLIALLAEMQRTPDLREKLALKGGTALQFLHLGFRRLSVDIDFNYIGSLERAKMERDRGEVNTVLMRLFKQQGYDLDEERDFHAEHSSTLAYRNCAGNRDRIKVEINYLERLSVLKIKPYPMHHPFGTLGKVSIPSYLPEELFAMKTRALVARATPRDLFDVHLIASGTVAFDELLYRELLIYYLCMSPQDVRTVTTERIQDITGSDVRRHLLPLLRKGASVPNLDEMKAAVTAHVDGLLAFSEKERLFLDCFYDEKRLDQELLFGGMPVSTQLANHPAILWRLHNMG